MPSSGANRFYLRRPAGGVLDRDPNLDLDLHQCLTPNVADRTKGWGKGSVSLASNARPKVGHWSVTLDKGS